MPARQKLNGNVRDLENSKFGTDKKKVSLLIPCRNEIAAIQSCLDNIHHFEEPKGGFEAIIIDGMSDDGTRDIIKDWQKNYPELTLIDNHDRTIPQAMNLGLKSARGEYIIRTDVRCIHPKTYLKDLIALSEKFGADNVGGVLEPIGNTYVQKSIALSYKSSISMGGALRDRGNFAGETDAVYGGCFKRKRLLEIGGYDEEMIKNEDDELSFRLRKLGGKVIQSGSIKIKYFPRKKFSQLFKQFLQYGYWKVPVLKKYPKEGSLRHLAPSLLILGFAILILAALVDPNARIALGLYSSIYFTILGLESLRVSYKKNLIFFPSVILSIVLIHLGYGLGFLIGLSCSALSIKPKSFEALTR